MEGTDSNIDPPRTDKDQDQSEEDVDVPMDHDGNTNVEPIPAALIRRPRTTPTPSDSKLCQLRQFHAWLTIFLCRLNTCARLSTTQEV